jgi:hypothetical protein
MPSFSILVKGWAANSELSGGRTNLAAMLAQCLREHLPFKLIPRFLQVQSHVARLIGS